MSVIPAPSTGRVVMSKMLTTAMDHDIKQKFKTETPMFRDMWSETKNVIAPSSEDKPST
jgi:hypothetical protein